MPPLNTMALHEYHAQQRDQAKGPIGPQSMRMLGVSHTTNAGKQTHASCVDVPVKIPAVVAPCKPLPPKLLLPVRTVPCEGLITDHNPGGHEDCKIIAGHAERRMW